ncbi:MAG: amidase [Planctomycetes bacterium]|nr:amidase [Planctomycetota bacterium]
MKFAADHVLLRSLLALSLSSIALAAMPPQDENRRTAAAERIEAAGELIGIGFTPQEIELMLPSARTMLRNIEALRNKPLGNEIYPAFAFSPYLPGMTRRAAQYESPRTIAASNESIERPAKLESLYFADIRTLGALVHARKVTCVELTDLFLARLHALDDQLSFVVSFCEERARATAKRLDEELVAGKDRGALHGIPYGAKDLLAARGAPTTWGAAPYREQAFDKDAHVIERLEERGAVLLCKTTLGALAMGDVWFGGTTKNPWNPKQGSSGSSAGSASAVAAGALPFAIGSETLGSIVSPSVRCGCSSLRPTFGRVARTGAMTLSWTMDKLGPIARSAQDAAIVFDAMHGSDGRDPTARDAPFVMPESIRPGDVRIGVLRGRWTESGDGSRFLAELEKLGFRIGEVELPRFPLGPMLLSIQVEGAAAFDELTRSGRDDELVRQTRDAWPNLFRAARLVPAVEYLQANRLRTELMRAFDDAFREFDVLVHPPFAGGVLGSTNLTGHPTFVAPFGSPGEGSAPPSVCFTGQLDDEARLLAVALQWQTSTSYHTKHPKL